jgi:uncharacterized protein YndB with AHSA1/START domain
MANKLTAKVSVELNAAPSRVWKALTEPALIKEYLFGTDTKTDWKKGSPITYSGAWDGKTYEDKGIIKEIIPEKLLHTTYYSPLSGKEDKPENYANVNYEIHEKDGHTLLTVSQDNIDDEKSVEHMKNNWQTVLNGLKAVVEK